VAFGMTKAKAALAVIANSVAVKEVMIVRDW
jgi:hypothetical protein